MLPWLQQGVDCLLCLLHHSHMVLQQLAQPQDCLRLQEHLVIAQAALLVLLLPAPAACMPPARPAADKASLVKVATFLAICMPAGIVHLDGWVLLV